MGHEYLEIKTAGKKLYSSVARARVPETVHIFQSQKYIKYENEEKCLSPRDANA